MGLYDKKFDFGFPIDARKALGAVLIIIAIFVIAWIFLFVLDLFKPMAITAVLSPKQLKENEQNSVLNVTLTNVTGKMAKNVEIIVQAEDASSILVDADEIAKKKIEVLEAGAFKKLQFDVRKSPVKKVLPGSYKINIQTKINGQQFTKSVFLIVQ